MRIWFTASTHGNPQRQPRTSHLITGLLVIGVAGMLSACSTGATSGDGAQSGATPGTDANTQQQCSELQLAAYPVSLPKPAADYYQGPTCQLSAGTTGYYYRYEPGTQARLTEEQRMSDVRTDGQTMVLELEAQGYQRVCGTREGDEHLDATLESSKSDTAIRITVLHNPGAEPVDELVITTSPATRAQAIAKDQAPPACESLARI